MNGRSRGKQGRILGFESLESRELLNGHRVTPAEPRSGDRLKIPHADAANVNQMNAQMSDRSTSLDESRAKGHERTKRSAPHFDPNQFVAEIDNPYFPLVPGTTFIYRGTKDGERARDEFFVTHETKQILGVTTTVIRDRAFIDDELVEETFDWFAQDRAGNVWYLGEDSSEIENGEVVSKEGSWEAGVDGARPGIVMEAHPRVGDSYRQEFAKGVAEDRAEVLSLDQRVTVPYGSFDECLKTKDFSRLDPGVVETKYYCRGVGFVQSVMVRGGSELLELVKVIKPPQGAN